MKKSKFLNLSLLSITIIGGVTFTGTSLIKNSETLDKDTSFNFFGTRDEIDNNGEIRFLELEEESGGAIIRDPSGKDHLYMWGSNKGGQLGLESPENVLVPTEIEIPDGEVKDFSMGAYNSAMVITNEDGEDELYTWGSRYGGALGDGTYELLDTTAFGDYVIKRNNLIEKNIVSIEVGTHNMGAWVIDEAGKEWIYTWGTNNNGEMGFNFWDTGEDTDEYDGKYVASPLISPFVTSNILTNGNKIEKYVVSGNNTMILIRDLNDNQYLYGWGGNDAGELGEFGSPIPEKVVEIPQNEEVKDIELSYNNSAIITIDSLGNEHLYIGGSNSNGQMINLEDEVSGDDKFSHNIYISEENEVNFDNSIVKIEEVFIGDSKTAFGVVGEDVSGNQHLFMWGNNENMQIGHESPKYFDHFGDSHNYVREIFEISDLPLEEMRIVDFKTQKNSSIALLEDPFGNQTIYTWGTNTSGVLGIGGEESQIIEDSTSIDLTNAYSTSTTFDATVKDHIFTFKIDSPIDVKEELLIYNQNEELIGIAKLDVENDLYYGLIINGKDLNDQILYWSNGFDKTLNLISEVSYSFGSIEWVSNIPTIDWELIKDKIIEIVWNYIIAGITSDVIENLKDEIIETIQELGLEEFFNSIIDFLVENEITNIINSPSFQENFDKVKEVIVRNAINNAINSDGFDDKWNEIIDEIIENNVDTSVDPEEGNNDDSNVGLIIAVSILSIVLIALIVTLVVMYFINKDNDDEDDSEEEFISNGAQLA